MTTDRADWDRFDKAQSGELQTAEARIFGLLVNPYYILGEAERTRTAALAMKLVPWVQELHEDAGNRAIDPEDFREHFDESELAPDVDAFERIKGFHALENTGLVSVTRVNDPDTDTKKVRSYSLTRRAVEAEYRDVIEPHDLSCAGCLGRLVFSGAAGFGATIAYTEAMGLEANSGLLGQIGRGLMIAGAAFAISGLAERPISVINAARVHRQYQDLRLQTE